MAVILRREKNVESTEWDSPGGAYTPLEVGNMLVRFCQLRRKEVINLCDGCKLGYVGDLEICLPEGTVKAIIVFGPFTISAARFSRFLIRRTHSI